MIHEIVPSIVTELNRFLMSKHNLTEEKALMSHLVNADGSMAVQETDKIIVTLVSIEAERSKSTTSTYKPTASGGFTRLNPPVDVNIYLLFSAYFTSENYVEGLKFITSVIAFFQSRQGIFTTQNTPSLNGIIDKLNVEMVSPDLRDQSNVWSGIGAKYLPSVLYRVKTMPIEHILPTAEISSIKST
jgi:hypothetical protein